MRKRILCALCCTFMLTGLVGCSNAEPEQQQSQQQNQQQTTTKNEEDSTQEETKPVNDLSYGISKNTKVPTATSSEEEMKAFYEEVLTLPIPKGRGFLLPVAKCD